MGIWNRITGGGGHGRRHLVFRIIKGTTTPTRSGIVCFSIGDTIASVGGNVNGNSNGITTPLDGSLVCASRNRPGTARDEDETGSFDRPPLVNASWPPRTDLDLAGGLVRFDF